MYLEQIIEQFDAVTCVQDILRINTNNQLNSIDAGLQSNSLLTAINTVNSISANVVYEDNKAVTVDVVNGEEVVIIATNESISNNTVSVVPDPLLVTATTTSTTTIPSNSTDNGVCNAFPNNVITEIDKIHINMNPNSTTSVEKEIEGVSTISIDKKDVGRQLPEFILKCYKF